MLWNVFMLSDLSLAHRHDGCAAGDRLDIVSANADELNGDDDLVLADRDEFLGFDLLALPHPPHPQPPLTHAVVATIDSAVERRVRVVQHDVGRPSVQLRPSRSRRLYASTQRRAISTFSCDIAALRIFGANRPWRRKGRSSGPSSSTCPNAQTARRPSATAPGSAPRRWSTSRRSRRRPRRWRRTAPARRAASPRPSPARCLRPGGDVLPRSVIRRSTRAVSSPVWSSSVPRLAHVAGGDRHLHVRLVGGCMRVARTHAEPGARHGPAADGRSRRRCRRSAPATPGRAGCRSRTRAAARARGWATRRHGTRAPARPAAARRTAGAGSRRLDPDRARHGLDRAAALHLEPVAAGPRARGSRSVKSSPVTGHGQQRRAVLQHEQRVGAGARGARARRPITRAVNSTAPPRGRCRP